MFSDLKKKKRKKKQKREYEDIRHQRPEGKGIASNRTLVYIKDGKTDCSQGEKKKT